MTSKIHPGAIVQVNINPSVLLNEKNVAKITPPFTYVEPTNQTIPLGTHVPAQVEKPDDIPVVHVINKEALKKKPAETTTSEAPLQNVKNNMKNNQNMNLIQVGAYSGSDGHYNIVCTAPLTTATSTTVTNQSSKPTKPQSIPATLLNNNQIRISSVTSAGNKTEARPFKQPTMKMIESINKPNNMVIIPSNAIRLPNQYKILPNNLTPVKVVNIPQSMIPQKLNPKIIPKLSPKPPKIVRGRPPAVPTTSSQTNSVHFQNSRLQNIQPPPRQNNLNNFVPTRPTNMVPPRQTNIVRTVNGVPEIIHLRQPVVYRDHYNNQNDNQQPTVPKILDVFSLAET